MNENDRICKKCGKVFQKEDGHQYQKCPECRSKKDRQTIQEQSETLAYRELKDRELTQTQIMRNHLAERDRAFAKWEKENGVRVRTYQRDGKIFECRGMVSGIQK